jgi:hypothetical protein
VRNKQPRREGSTFLAWATKVRDDLCEGGLRVAMALMTDFKAIVLWFPAERLAETSASDPLIHRTRGHETGKSRAWGPNN